MDELQEKYKTNGEKEFHSVPISEDATLPVKQEKRKYEEADSTVARKRKKSDKSSRVTDSTSVVPSFSLGAGVESGLGSPKMAESADPEDGASSDAEHGQKENPVWNGLDSLCLCRCKICSMEMYHHLLKAHWKRSHGGATKRRVQFDFTRKNYHRCRICDDHILYTLHHINRHCRQTHQMTASVYRKAYLEPDGKAWKKLLMHCGNDTSYVAVGSGSLKLSIKRATGNQVVEEEGGSLAAKVKEIVRRQKENREDTVQEEEESVSATGNMRMKIKKKRRSENADSTVTGGEGEQVIVTADGNNKKKRKRKKELGKNIVKRLVTDGHEESPVVKKVRRSRPKTLHTGEQILDDEDDGGSTTRNQEQKQLVAEVKQWRKKGKEKAKEKEEYSFSSSSGVKANRRKMKSNIIGKNTPELKDSFNAVKLKRRSGKQGENVAGCEDKVGVGSVVDGPVVEELSQLCLCECLECGEVVLHHRMNTHQQELHNKKKADGRGLGSPYKFVRKTFYRCPMCGELLLFSFLKIGIHLNRAHAMKLQDFKNKYFGTRTPVEWQAVERESSVMTSARLPSPSASQNPKARTSLAAAYTEETNLNRGVSDQEEAGIKDASAGFETADPENIVSKRTKKKKSERRGLRKKWANQDAEKRLELNDQGEAAEENSEIKKEGRQKKHKRGSSSGLKVSYTNLSGVEDPEDADSYGPVAEAVGKKNIIKQAENLFADQTVCRKKYVTVTIFDDGRDVIQDLNPGTTGTDECSATYESLVENARNGVESEKEAEVNLKEESSNEHLKEESSNEQTGPRDTREKESMSGGMCQCRCLLCGEVLLHHLLKVHMLTAHQRSFVQGTFEMVVTTYHSCGICGKNLMFSFTQIGYHVERSHALSLAEYRARFLPTLAHILPLASLASAGSGSGGETPNNARMGCDQMGDRSVDSDVLSSDGLVASSAGSSVVSPTSRSPAASGHTGSSSVGVILHGSFSSISDKPVSVATDCSLPTAMETYLGETESSVTAASESPQADAASSNCLVIVTTETSKAFAPEVSVADSHSKSAAASSDSDLTAVAAPPIDSSLTALDRSRNDMSTPVSSVKISNDQERAAKDESTAVPASRANGTTGKTDGVDIRTADNPATSQRGIDAAAADSPAPRSRTSRSSNATRGAINGAEEGKEGSGEMCLTRCKMCQQQMGHHLIRNHLKEVHALVDLYWEQYEFSRKTFTACAICGKQLLNSYLVIEYHVIKEHRLKLDQYKQQYMIKRHSTVVAEKPIQPAAAKLDDRVEEKHPDDADDRWLSGCLCRCMICGAVLIFSSMRGHMRLKHAEVPGRQTMYRFLKKTYCRCNICGKKILNNSSTLGDHVRKSHRMSILKYREQFKSEEYSHTAPPQSPATPQRRATPRPQATPQPRATPRPQATLQPRAIPRPHATTRSHATTPQLRSTPQPQATPLPRAAPPSLPEHVRQNPQAHFDIITNDASQLCLCKCVLCGKELLHHQMMTHVEYHHGVKVNKESSFTFLRRTFHRCQLCEKDVLFSYLAIGSHMRDRHPSINFIQYKLTHFHEQSDDTPSRQLYRCHLCHTVLREHELLSHLDGRHRDHFRQITQRKGGSDDGEEEKEKEETEEERPRRKKRPRPASMFYDETDLPVGSEDGDQLDEEELVLTDSEATGEQDMADDNDDLYELHYSNDVHEMCLSRCNFCGKILPLDRIFVHLNQAHSSQQFNGDVKYQLVRKTYHRCRLCGEPLLFTFCSIETHLSKSHLDMSLQDYKDQFMGFDEQRFLYRPKRQEETNSEDPDSPESKSGEVAQAKTEFIKAEQNGKELKEEKWYDRNTFHCKLCGYESRSLALFGRHAKKEHDAQLESFAASYSRTKVYYECQFCLDEVYHEKSAIEKHVQTHFLTIKKYEKLYESLIPLRMEALEIILNDDDEDDEEKGKKEMGRESDEVEEKSILPAIPPVNIIPVEENNFSCPINNCGFIVSQQGLKNGTAASHLMSTHEMQPWRFRRQGLAWIKVYPSDQ